MSGTYTQLPQTTVNATNPSVGPTGSTAPTSATEIGGVNAGNLVPVSVDGSGNVNVNVINSTTDQNVNLTKVGGAAITEGQKTMSASLPVVIASDQSAVPISAASLPLPAGAATSANQTNASQKTQVVDGSGNVVGATTNALDVNIKSSGASNLSTNIAQINGVTPLMGNGVTGTGSLRVTLASDTTSNTNPLLTNARQTGTFTDRSGTTSATPSTSTQVAASNASRKYFFIVNASSSNTIWINFTTSAAATQPSIPVLPNASFVMESGFVSTEAINVLCTIASSPYSAKEA